MIRRSVSAFLIVLAIGCFVVGVMTMSYNDLNHKFPPFPAGRTLVFTSFVLGAMAAALLAYGGFYDIEPEAWSAAWSHYQRERT